MVIVPEDLEELLLETLEELAEELLDTLEELASEEEESSSTAPEAEITSEGAASEEDAGAEFAGAEEETEEEDAAEETGTSEEEDSREGTDNSGALSALLLSTEEADSLEISSSSVEKSLSSTGKACRKSAILLLGASPSRSAMGAVSA